VGNVFFVAHQYVEIQNNPGFGGEINSGQTKRRLPTLPG